MAAVLVCDPFPRAAIERMRAGGLQVDERAGLSPQELTSILNGYDAVVVRSATRISREQVEAAARLRLIVRGGVGLDNIDVEAARERGVRVLNTPAASSVSVAELALGLMFALARKIPQADASMKAGRWEKKALGGGTELEGKTLGVLGVGRIGGALARRAFALGLGVLGADKFLGDDGEVFGVPLVGKDELLERSDILSVHVPRAAGDPPEVGEAELSRMKHGVLVINCARGGVVDEGALLRALEGGKVAGAGLDVYESEPPVNRSLVNHPRVICTPHIGASTREAQERVGLEVADILLQSL